MVTKVTKSQILSYIKSSCFTYETPKVVVIESRCVGVMHKVMQFLLFGIVIVWIFIKNNGYQFVDSGAIGGTTSKLKGIAFTNSSDDRVGKRVWDSADLHVPPQDSGSFFLTTNYVITTSQVQSVCPDLGEWSTVCSSDEDCLPAGQPYHLAHGVSTGQCNTTFGYCMVNAWCPIENDTLPEHGKFAVLNDTKDFTVLLKNHVYFPHFKKGRSNLIESITKKKLRGCRYDPEDDPYCPIFRLSTVVGMAGLKSSKADRDRDDKYFEEAAIRGAVITITVQWDCNFDYAESECKPKYSFARLDDFQPTAASPGYNFRYRLVYVEDGVQKRQLIKAFGILFLLNTEATARAFETTTFLLNVGSGLALLGIASIVADILLLNIHKNRQFFKKFKRDPTVTVEQRKNEVHKRNDGENECPMDNSNESSEISQKAPPLV